MAGYFVDSSALAKRYISEPGSTWILTRDYASFSMSALVVPEIASTLARREREGVLSSSDASLYWRAFQTELRSWVLIALTEAILSRAADLLRAPALPVPLRTLDAVQLACALQAQEARRSYRLEPLTFLTADDRLEVAARHFELETDNPLRHA